MFGGGSEAEGNRQGDEPGKRAIPAPGTSLAWCVTSSTPGRKQAPRDCILCEACLIFTSRGKQEPVRRHMKEVFELKVLC